MAKIFLARLTENDLKNLIAFGNRADMKGAEADTWVDLKQRLAQAEPEGDKGTDEADDDLENLSPGGSA